MNANRIQRVICLQFFKEKGTKEWNYWGGIDYIAQQPVNSFIITKIIGIMINGVLSLAKKRAYSTSSLPKIQTSSHLRPLASKKYFLAISHVSILYIDQCRVGKRAAINSIINHSI